MKTYDETPVLERQSIIGMAVVTSDGSDAGRVKEVRGSYFRVDAPMAADFWMSSIYIASAERELVVLRLRKDEIDEHRLDEPGLDDDLNGDGAISPAEALTQRERMERELAVQREELNLT